MHAALAEMAQMQSEMARLEEAAAKAAHMPPPPSAASSSGYDAGTSYSSGGDGSAPFYEMPPDTSLDEELSRLKRNTRKDLNSELRQMKRKKAARSASLDDELAALKRKMQNKKKP